MANIRKSGFAVEMASRVTQKVGAQRSFLHSMDMEPASLRGCPWEGCVLLSKPLQPYNSVCEKVTGMGDDPGVVRLAVTP